MDNRLILVIVTVISFIGIYIVFSTVVNAKSFNLFCSKQDMLITLKNEAKMDISKEKILKISKIKIIHITDRDKEWSKMVNKMDLPKMENPFKNEFIIRMNKKENIKGIYEQIKEMDFVEDIQYIHDTRCTNEKNK